MAHMASARLGPLLALAAAACWALLGCASGQGNFTIGTALNASQPGGQPVELPVAINASFANATRQSLA
jgi:hypothetical protein